MSAIPHASPSACSARGRAVRLAAAPLLLACCAMVSMAADVPDEGRVRSMILAGETARAVEAARHIIAANPRAPEGHVLLANALLHRATLAAQSLPPGPDGNPPPIDASDADAIVIELESAIALAPERKDLYLGLVEIAQTAGREDEMLRQVERAAKRFPSDAGMTGGLVDIGNERWNRGRKALAGRILEMVHAHYKTQPDAILAWAGHLLREGDIEPSVQVLRDGATALPRDPTVLQALGDAACYQRDFALAGRAYATAAANDPKGQLVRLGWVATLHVKDQKAARTIAEPLWGREQGNLQVPTVQLNVDADSSQSSRIARAGGLLLHALSRPTVGALEAYFLARSLWQSGFLPAAMAETEVALGKDSSQLEAWMLRAEIYQQIGLGRQALEATERAGAIYEAAGDRVFGLTKDEVIAARAAALGRLGRGEEALAAYRRTSDPARYDFQAALVIESLGRIEEARALLEKVVSSGANPAEVAAAKMRLGTDTYRKKP